MKSVEIVFCLWFAHPRNTYAHVVRPKYDCHHFSLFPEGLSLKEIRQIYDWNVSPEDLARIEKMDAMAAADDDDEVSISPTFYARLFRTKVF